MKRTVSGLMLFVVLSLLLVHRVQAVEVPYVPEDRDRLIRIETTLKELKESINKQFEQVDKRLEFIQNLMIAMLAVFGSLCGIFVGLLLWDRKTFKEKAKEEAIKAVEDGKVKDIIAVLKEIAKKDSSVGEALRKFNLL